MKNCFFAGFMGLAGFVGGLGAAPGSVATAAFDRYIAGVESRLERQHRSSNGFIVPPASSRRGEPLIERLTPAAGADLPGALLHHWRGTAFVPGIGASDFEGLLRDFSSYPRYFSPEVLKAGTMNREGDRLEAWMRVRQRHVITVVMDTSYDVTFGRLNSQHGYSVSRSTEISEIDAPGTAAERPLSDDQEHGFLWRLNTYWSYEEREGGLAVQVETVSLSRSIPRGLGWALGPYVESVPRESLEFTLRSACAAFRAGKGEKG